MTCREFENAMHAEFGSVDRDEWRRRITREDWAGLPSSDYTAHLVACFDCQTSLFQFLDAPNLPDYRSYPCFHVCYFSSDVPGRCLWLDGGLYVIPFHRDKKEGVVIGFCPWCGIKLM